MEAPEVTVAEKGEAMGVGGGARVKEKKRRESGRWKADGEN